MAFRKFEDTDHAKVYSSYRPTVPQLVIDIILDYLSEQIDKNEWESAVDVGCGSGQCTIFFAKHFKNVYGFDISSAQIEEANNSEHPINVHYDLSPSESLSSVNSSSVQLLTASSAAHWFDLPNFFREVNRILVSKGVVALFSHFLWQPINPFKPNDQRLTQVYKDLCYDPLVIDFLPKNVNQTIETQYRNIIFPVDYHYVYRDDIIVKRKTTADRVIGHLKRFHIISICYNLIKLRRKT